MNAQMKTNGQGEHQESIAARPSIVDRDRGSIVAIQSRIPARPGRLKDAWQYRPAPRRKSGIWEVRDGYNCTVAEVYQEVDARLITAAPRLRRALTALMQSGQSDHARAEALAEAQAILREAAA